MEDLAQALLENTKTQKLAKQAHFEALQKKWENDTCSFWWRIQNWLCDFKSDIDNKNADVSTLRKPKPIKLYCTNNKRQITPLSLTEDRWSLLSNRYCVKILRIWYIRTIQQNSKFLRWEYYKLFKLKVLIASVYKSYISPCACILVVLIGSWFAIFPFLSPSGCYCH